MAIVFTSPRKKGRTFFWVATFLLLLVFLGISVTALLPEIQDRLIIVPTEGGFTMPDIKMNFALMDSDKVKNLVPFADLQMEFNYVAIDLAGKGISGRVLATSKEEAQKIVEAMGLKISSLTEVSTERTNPFASYYSIAPLLPIQ